MAKDYGIKSGLAVNVKSGSPNPFGWRNEGPVGGPSSHPRIKALDNLRSNAPVPDTTSAADANSGFGPINFSFGNSGSSGTGGGLFGFLGQRAT